jgi:hypothetical protein
MATRAVTLFVVKDKNGYVISEVRRYKWTGLLNGDDGGVVRVPEKSEKIIQAYGTPGAAGNLTIEGTLDDADQGDVPTYATLVDPQGNAINITATNKIESILDNVLEIRPRVTAGDGTTTWTVIMLVTSPRGR